MKCEECVHERVCEGYSNCEEVGLFEPKRQHGEWILCSDRLPEHGEKVLCACQAGIYEVLELRDGWYHDNNHIYMQGFVIAWMPLPEPYKKEGEEE